MGSSDHGHDCWEAVHRLYHFLDGELTTERREAIKEHLDSCEPCLHAFDFEAELRRVVASRCRDEPPLELRDRLAMMLRNQGFEPDAKGPLEAPPA